MRIQLLRTSVLAALLASPTISVAQQSQLMKFLGNTARTALEKTVTQAGQPANSLLHTSDSVHASTGLDGRWLYPGFVPSTIDGYLHIRYGTSALDPFGNGIGGRPTCDPEFIGYAALHRTMLTAADLTRCLDLERVNDPSATAATLYNRLKAISGTRKYYIRGTIGIYKHNQVFVPAGDNPPLGSVLIVVKGGFIDGPSDDTAVTAGGSGWHAAPPGEMLYKIIIHNDLSNMALEQTLTHSYVFFSVGKAFKVTNTYLRGNVYSVPVTINKVVLDDGTGKRIVVTPSAVPSPAD